MESPGGMIVFLPLLTHLIVWSAHELTAQESQYNFGWARRMRL